MIIGNKTTAYPVPGISLDGGRKLYVEILPADNEEVPREIASWVEKALKTYAQTTPGVKFTKKTNCNPLRVAILEG